MVVKTVRLRPPCGCDRNTAPGSAGTGATYLCPPRPALGSRFSALCARRSALSSRLSALGSQLSALSSQLSAHGSGLTAHGSRLSLAATCRGRTGGQQGRRRPRNLRDCPAYRLP
ncbi:hypothetical protein C5B85_09580 [Pseudoclavibacter sp. AY1F1]|nr:hypothetical protein C5B85_09580 [Pseudoclavibacter sp. AY1F1]